MNILWVENHDRFAKIAVTTFLASHAVTVVPSLAAARAELSSTPLDLVMIDFDLDDGKGDELIADLRALNPRPPIIATSAHTFGNQALVAAGADAVCGKMEFANIASVILKVTQF